MESYGELLKNARESKNITLDTASRDTAIAKAYLEKLEIEDDASFPGEAYFLGFVKNYCSYLGVDQDYVIKLYHAKKIQESPIPTELLAHHTPKWILPAIIVSAVAVLVGLVFYFYYGVFKIPQKREEKARIIAENQTVHTYDITEEVLTKRLYKGDQLMVPDANAEGQKVTLSIKDTLGQLTVTTPLGNQIVDLSEERELDIDGDGTNDIIVYLSDISNSNPDRGAEVRIFMKGDDMRVADVGSSSESEIASGSVTPSEIILEDNRTYPFTVQVSFRGSCLFRYRVDRQEKIEEYYKSGDVVTVTPTSVARLWMSNGNALSVTVISDGESYPLEIAKAGQVKVEDIKWVRDNDGKYRLVVVDLD